MPWREGDVRSRRALELDLAAADGRDGGPTVLSMLSTLPWPFAISARLLATEPLMTLRAVSLLACKVPEPNTLAPEMTLIPLRASV